MLSDIPGIAGCDGMPHKPLERYIDVYIFSERGDLQLSENT